MGIPLEKIPSVKSERWKYTNLPRALKSHVLSPSSLEWGGNVALLNAKAPGVAQYGDTHLWDLNAENSKDIKFISSNEKVDIIASDGQWLSPRLVIDVKEGESITIVENHSGTGAYWKNMVVQINLGKNSKLHHYRVIEESHQGVSTIFTHAKIAKGATYEAFSYIGGSGFIRNQIHTEITGSNAHCGLSGVNLLSGEQHADTTITIEHQAPHCTSNQTYKSVIKDKAHGVFQGKVHVYQAAQKTDGYQLSNALILSPFAEMDTKPELEIYADDVKCSHGATTGRLDDEPMFYMRSRGIPEDIAKALLIEAFCTQSLDTITDADFAQDIKERIGQWLTTSKA
jgi:Fe-S cluster assembly protein SufD